MTSRFEGSPRGDEGWTRVGNAGVGLVRIALLFGSAAIALALVLAPIMERRTREAAFKGIGLDYIATGSIDGGGHIFTVRRSIMQPEPVCIFPGTDKESPAC